MDDSKILTTIMSLLVNALDCELNSAPWYWFCSTLDSRYAYIMLSGIHTGIQFSEVKEFLCNNQGGGHIEDCALLWSVILMCS